MMSARRNPSLRPARYESLQPKGPTSRRAPENEKDRVHQIAAQLPGQARILAEKILALLSKPKKAMTGMSPSKKTKLRPAVALGAIASGNISSLEALLAQLEAEEEEESADFEFIQKLMFPAFQAVPTRRFAPTRALRPAPVSLRPLMRQTPAPRKLPVADAKAFRSFGRKPAASAAPWLVAASRPAARAAAPRTAPALGGPR